MTGEIPGGLPAPEQMTMAPPVKHTTFTEFGVLDPQRTPDGGMQLTFVVPATGEAFIFPMNPQSAEALGKKLVAPSVALPNGNGLGAG